MNKKKKLPPIVQIAILTMVTTILWVGFEVYRAFTKEPAPVLASGALTPLDPTLDASSLNALQQRLYLSDQELTVVTPVPTPTAAPVPTATASATPTLSPEPTASTSTQSGQTQ